MTHNTNITITSFTENNTCLYIHTYINTYINGYPTASNTQDYVLTFFPPPTQYTLTNGTCESNKKELYFPVWFS